MLKVQDLGYTEPFNSVILQLLCCFLLSVFLRFIFLHRILYLRWGWLMLSSLSYPAQQMDNNISRRSRQQLAKTIDYPLNLFQERSKDSFLYSLSSVRRRSELVKTINCVKLIFNLVLNTNGSFTNSAPSPLIALFWKPEEIRRLQHCQAAIFSLSR